MAIDLMGKDPWGAIGSGGGDDAIGTLLGGTSVAAMGPYGALISVGLKLLTGTNDSTAAAGAADTLLNTSGYVVGEGDAQGGGLDSSKGAIGFAWPWWYWAAGSLVAIAIIKRAV